jgi:hypothetical protein
MKRNVVVNGGRRQRTYCLLDLEQRCVVFDDSETEVIAMARRKEANDKQFLARRRKD